MLTVKKHLHIWRKCCTFVVGKPGRRDSVVISVVHKITQKKCGDFHKPPQRFLVLIKTNGSHRRGHVRRQDHPGYACEWR
jgi:hypothetical protein